MRRAENELSGVRDIGSATVCDTGEQVDRC
jgi:hypothetical protein